jgi:hypothetical protein
VIGIVEATPTVLQLLFIVISQRKQCNQELLLRLSRYLSYLGELQLKLLGCRAAL